mmetsp:Transcript_24771/g.50885  ORF Transcript_24771/g.50885 Transcript_24771/m.50885 type:complete len:300 (-) Transcript_24771:792-1691(-)
MFLAVPVLFTRSALSSSVSVSSSSRSISAGANARSTSVVARTFKSNTARCCAGDDDRDADGIEEECPPLGRANGPCVPAIPALHATTSNSSQPQRCCCCCCCCCFTSTPPLSESSTRRRWFDFFSAFVAFSSWFWHAGTFIASKVRRLGTITFIAGVAIADPITKFPASEGAGGDGGRRGRGRSISQREEPRRSLGTTSRANFTGPFRRRGNRHKTAAANAASVKAKYAAAPSFSAAFAHSSSMAAAVAPVAVASRPFPPFSSSSPSFSSLPTQLVVPLRRVSRPYEGSLGSDCCCQQM